MKKLTIKEWDEDEMPREKFMVKGAQSLSNAELLAILIRSGNRNENAIELARAILNSADNNLGKLKRFSYDDFYRFNGMGSGKIVTILSAFEIARRAEMETIPLPQIYSSESAVKVIAPLLRDLQHEECWVLYLNRGNRLIAREKLSSGGLSATVMDMKFIIKTAIVKLASSIILVHNHPSGNRMPGEEDKIQTQRLKSAAKLCDIELLDHLIVAGGKYYSFCDEGAL